MHVFSDSVSLLRQVLGFRAESQKQRIEVNSEIPAVQFPFWTKWLSNLSYDFNHDPKEALRIALFASNRVQLRGLAAEFQNFLTPGIAIQPSKAQSCSAILLYSENSIRSYLKMCGLSPKEPGIFLFRTGIAIEILCQRLEELNGEEIERESSLLEFPRLKDLITERAEVFDANLLRGICELQALPAERLSLAHLELRRLVEIDPESGYRRWRVEHGVMMERFRAMGLRGHYAPYIFLGILLNFTMTEELAHLTNSSVDNWQDVGIDPPQQKAALVNVIYEHVFEGKPPFVAEFFLGEVGMYRGLMSAIETFNSEKV